MADCNVSIHSGKARLSVTNTASQVRKPGLVVVTPLSSQGSANQTPWPQVLFPQGIQKPYLINKLLLKAVRDATRKDRKTFCLRNLNPSSTCTCESLKAVIHQQLKGDIISGDFDVGYMDKTTVVSIRNSQDLCDIWNDVKKGKSVVIWCDSLREDTVSLNQKSSRKRKNADTEPDENEFGVKRSKLDKQEEKDRKVETVISALKKSHGANFTNMQYRIWSEMITGGPPEFICL